MIGNVGRTVKMLFYFSTFLKCKKIFVNLINMLLLLRWLLTDSSKVKKCKFQPQQLPMDISEKNETKIMHSITFKASSTVNR